MKKPRQVNTRISVATLVFFVLVCYSWKLDRREEPNGLSQKFIGHIVHAVLGFAARRGLSIKNDPPHYDSLGFAQLPVKSPCHRFSVVVIAEAIPRCAVHVSLLNTNFRPQPQSPDLSVAWKTQSNASPSVNHLMPCA
jgi:hypothetical protein